MKATQAQKEQMKLRYQKNKKEVLLKAKERYDPIAKKEYNQKYLRENKEKLKEKRREYYLKNSDKVKIKNYKYRKENIQKYRDYCKSYRKRNPQKVLAHRALNEAIRTGNLKRLPCVECGDVKSQGHHEDYSKPLEVIWLCQIHHSKAHAII